MPTNNYINQKLNSQLGQAMVDALSVHYKIDLLEQYDTAIFNMSYEKAMEKALNDLRIRYPKDKKVLKFILSKSFKKYASLKSTIYKRAQKYMLEDLRGKYGPYINVLRRPNSNVFDSNISNTFKTELGRLYLSKKLFVLFTTHSLERFEERALNHKEIYSDFSNKFHKCYGAEPCAFDYMSFLMNNADEYAVTQTQNMLYINVDVGIVACEIYEDFATVVKTFLMPEMFKESDATWKIFGVKSVLFRGNENDEEISGPTFLKPDFCLNAEMTGLGRVLNFFQS